jgi:putative aldouronate transport system permease protein
MIRDKNLSSKILSIFTYAVVILVFIIVIVPILHIVSVSFSHPDEIVRGHVGLWPQRLDFSAYYTILNDIVVPRSLMNSIFITGAGTLLNLVLTTLTAYGISKNELPFRKIIIGFFLITMFFSGGLIPKFLVVNSLGMYDSYWALIVPTAISAYNLIIMHSFFKNFPEELEQSAKLDGLNDFGVLLRIVLPLSKAAMATIGLFYAVYHWNSFFPAMIYLTDNTMYPLQLVLRNIVMQSQMADLLAQQGQAALADQMSSKVTPESIQYATLVVSMIPMLILYPFLQKYFVQGVMIGSLKG